MCNLSPFLVFNIQLTEVGYHGNLMDTLLSEKMYPIYENVQITRVSNFEGGFIDAISTMIFKVNHL